MRRFFLLLTIAVLASGRAPAGQNLVLDVFRDYLEALRTQAGIPGMAAALVTANDIAWEYGFGRQDIARNIAARTDTPFHVDATGQVVTAALVLRCVDEGRLSLDEPIGRFRPSNPDAAATVRQLLTHTTGAPQNPVFTYQPDRLEPLSAAIRACTTDSYRETVENTFLRFAMLDSVPGPDAASLTPPAEGIPEPAIAARYAQALERLATSYAVRPNRTTPTRHPAVTLTPSSGLISTARDLAKFDLALKQGALIDRATLQRAWQPATAGDGRALPHGLGWFVQTYNGEQVVWQFGLSEDAGSSLLITVPQRGLTFILLANSDGLTRGFSLEAGDVSRSPFARVFLNVFLR